MNTLSDPDHRREKAEAARDALFEASKSLSEHAMMNPREPNAAEILRAAAEAFRVAFESKNLP